MPISLTSVCCIFVVWLSYWYKYICMRACHDQWEKKEMKMETQCFSQCFNFVFVCAKSAYIQHQLSYFVRSSFFFVQLSFFFHNNQIDKSWNRKQIFEENKNVRELTGLLAISRQNLQPINILNSSFALVIIIFVVVYSFFCAFQT